eukprot:gene4757-5007_t
MLRGSPALVVVTTLVAVVATYHVHDAAAAKTAYVAEVPDVSENVTTLAEALKDSSVTIIFLLTDIVSHNGMSQDAPIYLTRNVTITSTDTSNVLIWNLQYNYSSIILCDTCTLALRNIAVAHDRIGAGPSIDFIAGGVPAQNGQLGWLLLLDSLRIRQACLTSAAGVKQALSLPRHPAIAGAQKASIWNFTFRERPYTDSLKVADVAVRVDRVHTEGVGWTGGYNMLFARLNQGGDAGTSQQQSQQGNSTVVVVVAVVVAVGSAVLVALLCFVVLRRYHSRRHRHQRPEQREVSGSKSLSATAAADDAGVSPPGVGPEMVVPFVTSKLQHWSHHPGAAPAHAVDASSSSTGSWKIMHAYKYNAVPSAAGPEGWLEDESAQVEDMKLGHLLGAGSFGRVYRGTWRGKDVAVKVIDHIDGHEAAVVGQEAKLLLSMSHPNIVKAYSCLTCTWVPSGRGPTQGSVPDQADSTAASDSQHSGQHHATEITINAADDTIVPSSSTAATDTPTPVAKATLRRTGSRFSAAVNTVAAASPVTAASSPASATTAAGDTRSTHARPSLDASSSLKQSSGITSTSSSQQTQPPPVAAQLTHLVQSTARQQSSGGSNPISRRPAACAARTWIVTEYCDGGALSDVLCSLRQVLDPLSQEFLVNLLVLLEQAAQGMAYTHTRHVVHGDLNVSLVKGGAEQLHGTALLCAADSVRARNVLVSTTEAGTRSLQVAQAVAKVSDFGLSRTVTTSHRTTETQGTITHMSPERLVTGRMAPAADVYAFGIMMWETWTGQSAFKGLHFWSGDTARKMNTRKVCQAVVTQNARPEIPHDVPRGYQELMVLCWEQKHEQRPSMVQVAAFLQQLLVEACAGSDGDISLGTTAAAVTAVVGSSAAPPSVLQPEILLAEGGGGGSRTAGGDDFWQHGGHAVSAAAHQCQLQGEEQMTSSVAAGVPLHQVVLPSTHHVEPGEAPDAGCGTAEGSSRRSQATFSRLGALQKLAERVTASIDRGLRRGGSPGATAATASSSLGGKAIADKAAWDRYVFDL